MTIKVKRQNGNIYVYERQIRYDPIKKYNIVVSNKLIGKILKGEDTIKNTRPKRAEKKSKDVAEKKTKMQIQKK